jgi:hypothetical protein
VRQVRGSLDRLTGEFHDDVTRLHARLFGRTARRQLRDQRTAGTIETEGLGQVAVDVLDRHAEPAPRHLTVLAQLRDDVAQHADGNGEGQTDGSATA